MGLIEPVASAAGPAGVGEEEQGAGEEGEVGAGVEGEEAERAGGARPGEVNAFLRVCIL